MARCRSEACQAPIIWVKTAMGGAMPIDAVEVPVGVRVIRMELSFLEVDDGNIVIEDGIARTVTAGTGRYRSHFASCPDADGWRKKR